MSEPDAVPLPREGEVFFDVRGEARSMRLSWYADSKVAVFSIWQGNRCTGTFRLPFVDLARMVQTLQSGPPVPDQQPPVHRDGYQGDPMVQASLPGAGPGYAAATAAYDSGPEPDVGYQYGQDRRYDYGVGPDYGPGPANPAYSPAAAHQDFGAASSYQSGPGYGADQDYGAAQTTGSGYAAGAGFAAAPALGTDQPYGGDRYQPGNPYGHSEPYRAPEPYRGGEQYRPTEQHGQGGQYRPTEQYNQGEQYGPGEQYGQGGGQYSPAEPYRTSRHGAEQPRHGRPDYDAPNFDDLPPYRDQRTVAGGPGATQRIGDWPLPAAPTQPKRGPDSDSVPDTAMMSFPSVPVRNGQSGYR